jgi:hypothetical protein
MSPQVDSSRRKSPLDVWGCRMVQSRRGSQVPISAAFELLA